MAGARTVRRLTGVCAADGGIRGELAFALGKARGTAHCALSDLTHAGRRRRPEWDALVATMGVPFEVVHLNERDEAVAAASEGRTPCVLAHTDSGIVVLLGPEDLAAIGTSVLRFDQTIREAADAEALVLPLSGLGP
ncbi:hypothetical protein [Yinghuangia sp. YIM S09857]|uniref:hypothetical protein n=1 Tax=Yinghuangia sp. YIM S09857 TaxID=3436929 RepID=UPI003F52D6B3